jgi:hypothetical protein
MRLTPVGAAPPPLPDDPEFKPAVGIWAWCPQLGELRIETNASIFRQAITSMWERCRTKPQAVEGLQPVVSFVDRVSVPGKTFWGPITKIIGWFERDRVPNWAARAPTVPPPAALPGLPVSPAPTPIAPAKPKAKAEKPGGNDPSDDLNDSIPF